MTATRRSFLKQVLAGAVAAGAAPLYIRADDKAASKKIIVGRDAHQYEVLDDWAKKPEGYTFGNTHAVAETADGRIFVHHAGGDKAKDSVAVFDPDGKFITSWGKEYRQGAHGMQLRKEAEGEFLYLATTSQRTVLKTDLDGKVLFQLEYPKDAKNADGKLCYVDGKDSKGKDKPAPNGYSPTNIAFHPTDGSFYVADGYGSNYVHKYDAKGQYLSTFGGKGSGDGQLSQPHGIWCDTRDAAKPLIVVADRANERLSYFDLDGKFVKISKPTTPNATPYRYPCHFDQRGEFMLIPGLHGVVSIVDRKDEVYTYLGDNPDDAARGKNGYPKDKLIPGIFVAPHGAIWTKAGDIYVGEWLPYGRVTKLRHLA